MTLHGSFLDADFSSGGSGFGGLQSRATNAQGAGTFGFGETDVDTPGIFGEGGFFGKGGGASIALGGIQTLGSLWNSFQQTKLAKSALKFQKNAFKVNLRNSTQVYNTALEDRIRARFATEGRSGEADAKIAENRL